MQDKKKRFLVPAVLPPFLCLILAIIAYFASIPVSYFFSPLNRIDSLFDLAVDTNIFYMSRSILYLVFFGLWYSHILFPGWTKTFGAPVNRKPEDSIWRKRYMHPLPFLFLIPLGFSIQYAVTSFFRFLQYSFPFTMKKYSEAITEMTEADANILYIIAIVILLPIAEEIIFRGISLHFAKKALSPRAAVILSAILYAVYSLSFFRSTFGLIFGLILGFLKEKSGGLVPPLLLHISFRISKLILPRSILSGSVVSLLILIGCIAVSFFLTVLSFRFYDGRKPFRSTHPDTEASNSPQQPSA